MRLPRRVPWETLAELELVCAWIYTDENDLVAKQHAVNRIAAWRVAVPLPHALESVHAILAVILQDGTTASSSSYLSLRMSYASAIIRLVNGLVDPLQLGAYARSIHSIAEQLGLPARLVELRHAATHEDLPSLEVLRDAARDAMNWLLHNYFLPTLNPTAPPAASAPPLRVLSPLLKRYKALMKATTRDATLHVSYRTEIAKATRDIERWISEAKVAAGGGTGWDDTRQDAYDSGEDPREKWALDKLSEVLLEKGMLVPLSKKKRLSSDHASLALPRASVAIWSSLLAHLQSLHPTLPLHLIMAITAHLSRTSSPGSRSSSDFGAESVSLSMETDEPKTDPSYDFCLASWAKWLADNCAAGTISTDAAEQAAELKESIIVRVLSAFGPNRVQGGGVSKAASALLQALSAERPKLSAALSILTQNPAQASQAWSESSISIMDRRLNTLLALQTASDDDITDTDTPPSGTTAQDLRLPPGWKKLSPRDGWRPAPIGVYISCQ